jgi:hypothetical protein
LFSLEDAHYEQMPPEHEPKRMKTASRSSRRSVSISGGMLFGSIVGDAFVAARFLAFEETTALIRFLVEVTFVVAEDSLVEVSEEAEPGFHSRSLALARERYSNIP